MKNYETLEKLVTLTRKMYEGTVCKVIHEGHLIESFEVKTAVRQVFFLLLFLFILVVDWLMKEKTIGRRIRAQWTPWRK